MPVKIAVLDTGIDQGHPIFEVTDALKGTRNCYDEKRRNVPDTNGHGTFIAVLVLEYAPDADLYVIKITDKRAPCLDAEIVAKVSKRINVFSS